VADIQQTLGHQKTCTKCGLPKDLDDFHKEARNCGPLGLGRYSWCKSCVREHKSTPERLNRTRYQIDFNAMWARQQGLCAVCAEPMLPKGKEPTSVVVDHDHGCCPPNKSCGSCVRGLIHQRCNVILGASGDDLRLLDAAIVYLKRWREGLT
jgi:hypothetical protein